MGGKISPQEQDIEYWFKLCRDGKDFDALKQFYEEKSHLSFHSLYDRIGWTPLQIFSSQLGGEKKVRWFLSRLTNAQKIFVLNQHHLTTEYTALHIACANERYETVEILLSEGANPNAKTGQGIRAIDVCKNREIRALVINSHSFKPERLEDYELQSPQTNKSAEFIL